MSSVEIPASEWDKVEVPDRAEFLRSKGVPIDEDGCYMPNFQAIECSYNGDQMVWVYYWGEE